MSRERKRRMRVNDKINMATWKEHFMDLLGGVANKVMRGRSGERKDHEESELEWEEVKRVIEDMKDGKVMGLDEIPNEVWKYGGEEMKR